MSDFTDRARAEAERRYWLDPNAAASLPGYVAPFLAGAEWAVSQEPTDEELLAAAWAVCRLEDEGYEPTEDHPCKACTESARAALTAAREARA